MNCKNCTALRWHPNKGFFCTITNCKPDTNLDDVKEIYRSISNYENISKQNNYK